MGAAHVAAVYAQWRQLPDRPFRVLAYMALIAKDSTTQPTYWGGRDGLCIALGMPADQTAYRVARRAVAELLEAGALERKYIGHAGKRSEYRVMVTPRKGDGGVPLIEPDALGSPEEGGQDSPPEGGHLSPQRGTPESAKGDRSVPPRTTRNTRSDIEEENSSPKVSTESAPAGESGMTEMEARRVIRNHTDDNGHALRMRSPLGLTGAAQTIWCARQILNSQEAS